MSRATTHVPHVTPACQRGGPVPWLDVDMDVVEEMQITMWAASEMDTSSLSIFPTNKPELPDEGILILQSVHMAL